MIYNAVNTMSILPRHALGDVKGVALRTSSLSRAPIGSGRFRFVKWNAGQSIELAADTSNYRDRPNLDRVILTVSRRTSTPPSRDLPAAKRTCSSRFPQPSAAIAKDGSVAFVHERARLQLSAVQSERSQVAVPSTSHLWRKRDAAGAYNGAGPQGHRAQRIRFTRRRCGRSNSASLSNYRSGTPADSRFARRSGENTGLAGLERPMATACASGMEPGSNSIWQCRFQVRLAGPWRL